jgi:hypothetical protein
MTPLMLPNRESGPQNQPKAKVAVSVIPGAVAPIGGIRCPAADFSFVSAIVALLSVVAGPGESSLIILML